MKGCTGYPTGRYPANETRIPDIEKGRITGYPAKSVSGTSQIRSEPNTYLNGARYLLMAGYIRPQVHLFCKITYVEKIDFPPEENNYVKINLDENQIACMKNTKLEHFCL